MNTYRIGGLAFLILSLVYGWAAFDITLDFWSEQETFNARSLPLALSGFGVLISLIALLQGSEKTWHFPTHLNWKPAIYLLFLMTCYGFCLDILGFFLATSLLLGSGFYLLGERRFLHLTIITLTLVLGFWVLMDSLGIYLDPGWWWHYLDSALFSETLAETASV